MGLNEKIISILSEHMGPSAPSFLAKQCKVHLNKEPSEITENDLQELSKLLQEKVRSILGDDVSNNVAQKILSLKVNK